MLLAHLGALLAVAMWGVSFVSTKVLLDNGMHPVEVAGLGAIIGGGKGAGIGSAIGAAVGAGAGALIGRKMDNLLHHFG